MYNSQSKRKEEINLTGLEIATKRINSNLTIKEMARILNISISKYKMVESKNMPLKLDEINSFCNIFNISLDTFFGLNKKKKQDNIYQNINYSYLKFSLKYYRKMARISQKDLANILGFSVSTISLYERNAHKASSIYIYLFANYFHVSIDYMCGKSLQKFLY